MTHAWFKNVQFKYVTLLASAATVLYSSVLVAAPLGTSPELSPPLGVGQTAKPLVMLVAAKDHKLFYEAYNDASDINGDGNLDIRFDPSITYFGLFDSKVCYTHANGGTNTGLFSPDSLSADTVTYKCPGKWSGNWLNYVTTSRIDALRKVLYGGFREVDTATETILRRAYIPQDTHAWAKEYTSTAVDGYNISDYTPLSQPSGSGTRRHFFGNTTMNAGINCATPDNCSVNLPPLMSVVQNSTKRVWDWVSSQAPVMRDGATNHGGTTRDNYAVRVKVCTGTFLTDCQQYGSSSFKPVGLLHDFGESEAMLFGLLSGSYNKNMSGGVLRKVVSSFKDEVNQSTGQFTASATIVQNFNALRIRDFNNGKTNASYRNGSFRTATMPEGNYVDWGNPVGEMMYESLRYFAGAKSPTSAFDTSGSHDAAIGLSRVATWDNPYESTSAAKAEWCARPNMLVMSDTYPSYDGDQVPGSPYSSATADAKISTFNAKTLLDNISQFEPGVKGERFAGQTTATNLDYAPSAKTVGSLAFVRGLAPEEPSKLGSYTSTAVAHYGKKTGIVTAAASGITPEKRVEMDSYFVTFGSHVPSLDISVNGRTVRVVPFAKTIDGANTNRSKGQYQPTDPIVDLYVRTIANTNAKNADASLNGGRPYMQYNIIYEADEQGNDFDQDINSLYTLSVNEKNEVVVEVQIIDESTGSNQNVGYVISGTNRDGIYLVTSDKKEALPYFLNTPPGEKPGYCDPVPASGTARYEACAQLPHFRDSPSNFNRSTETFITSTNPGASLLKDPFWYGAKWGGFVDLNGNGRPDLQAEWDADKNGVPDNYFLVQNPTKLKESLRQAFNNIYARSAAAGNIAANSTSFTSETAVYQSVYNSGDWSGDLIAYPVTQSGVGFSPLWRASTKMPSHTDRRIFTRIGTSGVAFNTSLVPANKTLIDPVSTTQDITINYLRGERSGEVQNGGSLRNRASSILGDIVNSSPYYLKDTDTVFVGSNAGMLHAFNAKTGAERFAFIPSAALPHLKGLTQTGYQHRFLVDGEMVVTNKNLTPNKNLLFGFMGRGAKGLFALDVTNPDTFATTNVLWEIGGADDDMGYLLGRPLVAKVKTGNNSQATVLIFGNGYNSTSGQAVVYVYNIDGTLLQKLSTGVGSAASPNGMATPFLVTDDEGFVNSAYAGDLQGNVWKFDLSKTNTNQWGSSLNQGSTPVPLFTAQDADGKAQPITAPITSYINNVVGDPHFGKRYVFFGTGKYLASEDPNNKDTQTLYGLIDEGSAITGRTQLKQRTVTNVGTFSGGFERAFSQTTANDMVGKKGWYLDWLIPPNGTQEGERVVSTARLISAFRPALVVSSIIPVVDPCVPGGGGYLNLLNPFSGGSLHTATDIEGIFINAPRNPELEDKLPDSRKFTRTGLLGECALVGNRLVCGGSDPNNIIDPEINMGKPERKRVSWREIIR